MIPLTQLATEVILSIRLLPNAVQLFFLLSGGDLRKGAQVTSLRRVERSDRTFLAMLKLLLANDTLGEPA